MGWPDPPEPDGAPLWLALILVLSAIALVMAATLIVLVIR